MSVTVRDIAKAAKVSVGTVSRALKNQPGMAERTRRRIRDIAVSLGYDFERLQSEPIRRIAFLLHRQHKLSATAFFSEVLHGVEDACSSLGVSLSFLAVGPADPVMAQLSRHEADALICAGYFEPELLQLLRQSGKPMVLVDQWSLDFTSVNPDNETGAYLVTRHLLDTGRQRIAFLAHSLAHFSIRQRERGFRRALFEAGILADPELDVVAPPGADVETGVAFLTRHLLALPKPPDAIFAYNDATALLTMRHCQEAGFSVPDDIAIAGFDDIAMAALSNPPLTTVHVDKPQLGRRGVELLMQAAATRSEETLPVELVVRDSTRPTSSPS